MPDLDLIISWVLYKMNKRTKSILLTILFIGIVVAFCVSICRGEKEPFQSQGVPKIIWSYWDNPETMPEAVKLCMQSWKKYNPSYEIRMLNKKNYTDYVKIPDEIANHPRFNDMPQRFADLLRCYLIAEHGGVWCDSSNLMFQSLDEWMWDEPGKELYVFSIEFGNHPGRAPVLENWFFAAPPRSPFVQKWLKEFLELMKFDSARAYVDDLVKRGLDTKDWCCPDYLAMHHSAGKLLQLDKYPLSKLKIWPTEKGPYRYLIENGWNHEKSFEAACTNPAIRKPFLKMRGNERGYLESHLRGKFSNERCKWI